MLRHPVLKIDHHFCMDHTPVLPTSGPLFRNAGLILFQKLGLKLAFPISGHRNLHIAETGAKGLAAVAIAAVIRFFVFVIVLAVTLLIIQFSIKTIFHKFGNSLLEQALDIFHAFDVAELKKFPNFSRRAFSSGERLLLLLIKITSNVVLLLYTTLEVYTNLGIVSVKKGNIVGSTIISAPSSTKNKAMSIVPQSIN